MKYGIKKESACEGFPTKSDWYASYSKLQNMKNLLLTLMVLFVLVACKSDNPNPAPEIEGIVGTWKYVATETIVGEKAEWVSVTGESTISFRQDGVILNSNGLPDCCAPKVYQVNDDWFVVNKDIAKGISEQCGPVDCTVCSTPWRILQTNAELIIFSGCGSRMSTTKYVRQ